MSESPTANSEKPSTSVAARVGWAVLILATLYVCYFSHLGAIGFVGPDEPRYAWIARAMTETGDWVTPRLYGLPWFEKPPLYYWGAALSFKLFGVSEAAARLPSALSALFATLALAWLALRIYGAETARWLLLLLPTTVGMIGFSHAAATDMPFSGMLTIAMVCAAVALRQVPATEDRASPNSANSPTPWTALILFGFFLGLAVLAKGPAGIILCGGAVFFWAIFTKRWRDAFRLLHPTAIAAFCLTALPWYILCARRNPDFFRVFIIEHNFKRYLTPEFQHIQPFWYYLPVILAALLPWSTFLLSGAVSFVSKTSRRQDILSSDWLLFCWSTFPVLFFSLSKSKLPGYILPSVLSVTVLTTHAIVRRLGDRFSARWLFSAVGVTLVALGITAYRLNDSIPFVTDVRPSPSVVLFATLATLGGGLVTLLAVSRRATASAFVVVGTMLCFLALDTGNLWELDDGVSARPMVAAALENISSEEAARAMVFKLRRSYKYQVDFYLHRETQEWSPDFKTHALVFTDAKHSEELVRFGAWCPHYIAIPAVWVCEYSKDGTVLMGHAASSGKP
ncbi:MAG: glycosyltransferase family 39 protein [Candidatus Acidiferrum sp.]